MALRFALAFLYAAGRGERWMFDEFWQCIGDPMTRAHSDAIGDVVRGTTAQSCLNGIARSVGIELTAEVDELVADACAPKAERDRRRGARDAIEQARATLIERARENARLYPLPGFANEQHLTLTASEKLPNIDWQSRAPLASIGATDTPPPAATGRLGEI